MGPFALLALLSGLMMSAVMSSSDETPEDAPEAPDVPETPETPDVAETPETPDAPETPDVPDAPSEPETPDLPADTGARFVQSGNSVTLDIGEDETGSLAVIYYTDDEDGGDQLTLDAYEARFYLVPEGVDWSGSTWETQDNVPGATEFGGNPYGYYLSDFEEHFGLELLGVVDFLQDPDALSGGISANAPVAGYSLDANTDGDELINFLPDDAPETRGGVEATVVTDDTTGSDGTDWLVTATQGVTLDGADGDDHLDTSGANSVLIGGAGNDVLTSNVGFTTQSGGFGYTVTPEGDYVDIFTGETVDVAQSQVTASGGDGDDSIRVNFGSADGGDGDDSIRIIEGTAQGGAGDDQIDGLANGSAEGGGGDDTLTSNGDADVVLRGQDGADNVQVSGAQGTGYGGDGDDFVAVNNGATGFGNGDNDHLQLDSGSTGDGGTGDDLFTVWNQFRDEDGPATATGGTGADTYDIRVWNGGAAEEDILFATITDFDPSEDVLQVGRFQTGGSVNDIEIVEHPSGSHTDVRVAYGSGTLEGGTAVIRLEGTPGITLDQVVILS